MYHLVSKKSRIVAYNTDSVCLTKPDGKFDDKFKAVDKYPVDKIGQIFRDPESTAMEVDKV